MVLRWWCSLYIIRPFLNVTLFKFHSQLKWKSVIRTRPRRSVCRAARSTSDTFISSSLFRTERGLVTRCAAIWLVRAFYWYLQMSCRNQHSQTRNEKGSNSLRLHPNLHIMPWYCVIGICALVPTFIWQNSRAHFLVSCLALLHLKIPIIEMLPSTESHATANVQRPATSRRCNL